jgi:hypothetical protein
VVQVTGFGLCKALQLQAIFGFFCLELPQRNSSFVHDKRLIDANLTLWLIHLAACNLYQLQEWPDLVNAVVAVDISAIVTAKKTHQSLKAIS